LNGGSGASSVAGYPAAVYTNAAAPAGCRAALAADDRDGGRGSDRRGAVVIAMGRSLTALLAPRRVRRSWLPFATASRRRSSAAVSGWQRVRYPGQAGDPLVTVGLVAVAELSAWAVSEYCSIVMAMDGLAPVLGDGSQKWEPAYSASLRLTATPSDCSRRQEAPRSTVPDVDRPTESAWHARGLGFESP